jgi:hypothetical protein
LIDGIVDFLLRISAYDGTGRMRIPKNRKKKPAGTRLMGIALHLEVRKYLGNEEKLNTLAHLIREEYGVDLRSPSSVADGDDDVVDDDEAVFKFRTPHRLFPIFCRALLLVPGMDP